MKKRDPIFDLINEAKIGLKQLENNLDEIKNDVANLDGYLKETNEEAAILKTKMDEIKRNKKC